jgi:P27 family predicted phage terminase small subunit
MGKNSIKVRLDLPVGLEPEVAEYMNSVVDFLKRARILDDIDRASLHILARQLDIFFQAAKHVKGEGMMVKNGRDDLVPNPKIAIMNQAEVMCLKIMKEYGLVAKSRKEMGKASVTEDSPLRMFLAK